MKQVAYAVHFHPALALGGYFATCRDLPGVQTHGDCMSEAMSRASEAMDMVLTVMWDEDEAPPVPTPALSDEFWISPSAYTQSVLKDYFMQMP